MTVATVACPKCAKPQEVSAPISPTGDRVTCSSCGASFVVKRAAPKATAATPTPVPAGSSGGTIAITSASRYYIRRKTGNSFGPFVEAVVVGMLGQKKLDGNEDISKDGSVWEPIASVPAFAEALAKLAPARPPPKPAPPSTRSASGRTVAYAGDADQPEMGLAPREAVPKFHADLPAPREAVPKFHADLPQPREAVPKFHTDLPQPREAVPKFPQNLPAPRTASQSGKSQPAAGGFTFDEFTPTGGAGLGEAPTAGATDLLTPLGGSEIPRTLRPATGLDLPAPKRPSARPEPSSFFPETTSGGGLDLSLDSPPNAVESPLGGAGFDLGGTLDLDGCGDQAPAVAHAPLELDPGPPAAAPGLALDESGGDTAALAGASPGGLDLRFDEPGALDGGEGLALDPSPPPAKPLSRSAAPASAGGGTEASGLGLDLGLSLDGPNGDAAAPAAVTGPGDDTGLRMSSDPAMPAPPLKPAAPRPQPPKSQKKAVPVSGPSANKKKRLAALGAGIVLLGGAATAGVFVFDLPARLRGRADLAKVLGTTGKDLDRDHFPAYAQAAKSLEDAAAGRPADVDLRAAAARILAESVVLRGAELARVSRAEKLLAEVPPDAAATPDLAQSRALVAIARSRFRDVDAQLAAAASGAQLVSGLRALAEGKAPQAVALLKQAAAAEPGRTAVAYALARAQEEAGLPEAGASYQRVLERNPSHVGAAVGLVRLDKPGTRDPAATTAKISDLIEKSAAAGSPTERAEAHLLASRAWGELGKIAEAEAAIASAVKTDPSGGSANLAAGQAALAGGRYSEALARFEVVAKSGSAAARSLDFRFGRAGALIGGGKIAEGSAGLALAAKEKPDDPRGPFWRGRAAELAPNPDLAVAAEHYREARKQDPKFIPASLHLASILIREGKAPDALALLKEVEDAGAPAADLQLAWGLALLASGEPARAKAAFAKALEANPKLEAARGGIAGALEALGSLDEAKAELDKLLADSPASPGLRERIAGLLVKQGKKEEALVTYQAEIKAGTAAASLKVGAARLALDIGKHDEARAIIDKVIEADPRTPDAVFTSAKIYRAKGQLAAALPEFKRAISIEDRPVTHYEYGRALAEGGKDEAALVELGLGSSLPEARIERARILIKKGDVEGGRADLESALKEVSGDAGGYFLLGNCYARIGDSEKAGAAWKNAIKLDPELAEARYQVGRLEMERGRWAQALEHLRKAAEMVTDKTPWAADLYFELGNAEKSKGKRPAACAAFNKYLDLAAVDAPARPEVKRFLADLGC